MGKRNKWFSLVLLFSMLIGIVQPAAVSAAGFEYNAVQPSATNLTFEHTPAAALPADQDAAISVSITGNAQTVTASVYYKTDVQTEYTTLAMTAGDGIIHTAAIPSQGLAGGTLLQYYVEAADGDSLPQRSVVYSAAIQGGAEKKLQIVHTPAQRVDVNDLEVSAKIDNPENAVITTTELLFKTPSQSRYQVVPMTQKNGDEYAAVIPASALVEPVLNYKIRVNDVAPSYSVNVNLPAFDPAKAPPLLVTKLVPNTTNVPGTSTDAYELIEIYNNTDQPIDFKNFKMYYRYPDKGPQGDVKWASTKEDFVIPAGQPAVFWIVNTANSHYTADDFNQFHKTNLIPDTNLFVIKSDGMANSGSRAVVIKTNTGEEVSAAYYDANTVYDGGVKDETKENKAIEYKYPLNGSRAMIKTSSGQNAPVPGVVNSSQVPSVPVHVELDTVKPTAEDRTGVTEIDQSNPLDLKAFADDDKQVVSVHVFVRSDKQPDFSGQSLTQDYNDKLYHYNVSSADLIGRKYIEYYFVVSDGMNETETAKVKVNITGGPDQSPLRLSVKDGDTVNGTRTIKATSQTVNADALKLTVDGKELAPSPFFALEHDAYFVFEAKGVDYYFKNAVTMGPPEDGDKTILHTFMDPISTYATLSVPIDASRLQAGTNNVIYIRAGSKSSPFDTRPEENKDDFEVRNVRLVLADGTEIWDPLYAVRDKELKMGDSTGKSEWIGFGFDLKPEYFRSKAYLWDTRQFADGGHEISVEDGSGKATSNVMVDNTPPVIKPNVEEGKEYRGHFTIDAVIEDRFAGVDQMDVKLDGRVIALPYAVSSGTMTAGEHKLEFSATDKAGNQAVKTVNFTIPEENPMKPVLVAPTNGKTDVGNSATLTVKAQDPTHDPMDVTFYRGFQYDGKRAEGFAGFKNVSETEPPKAMIPQGEQPLTAEEYGKIGAVDGNYLVNESVEQFPYQRYEIKLDPTVKATDRVDIVWQGKSLEGRKVSLYAWSKEAGKWELLDNLIAGNEDFELKATVKAGDYADGQTIQVIVQDEIGAAASAPSPTPENQDPYDFSFVWMSDTQYYSQSYPHIYQDIVNWIADNKESNKIQYVIHTGDIVDKSYQEYQWQEADKDMKVLENAGIPYGVLAGNHDVGHQDNDYAKYWQYFGDWRFKDMPTFGASYENNRGHYDLVSAGGNDFIIVYMGWGLGDKEIEWMNEVVSKYPERKAILCLHEYMLVSNNRAPIAEKIFEKVIKPNKNVIAALSGHYHDAQIKIDELDDNGEKRKVFQMLADYQGGPEGGLGYIRLMQFDVKNNKLHIKTYSPYLNDYNYYDADEYPGKDEFSLDLDLQPKTKRVATDYIGVKVYTDQRIGKQGGVQNGKEASVTWNGLQANSYYQWYAQVEDANSGNVLSDVWGFHTGKSDEGGHPGNPGNPGNPGDSGNSGNPNGSGGSSAGTKPAIPGKPEEPADQGEAKDKGVIKLNQGQGDSYKANRAALEKAVKESESGKVTIMLNDAGGAGKPAAIELDAAGVLKAKERKLTIEIVAPGVTVTLPAIAWPTVVADADKVIVQIDPTLNPSVQAALNKATLGSSELAPSRIAFTLKLVTVKGQMETSVHQLDGPVTVERALTAEESKQLRKDYAGVYELNEGKARYIGGTFERDSVRFATDLLSQFAVMEYHKKFTDLTGSWAEEYIRKLAAKHIVTGVDGHQYQPDRKVTRADFVTLAVRALGIDPANGKTAFNDVASNDYYAAYVSTAAELGLIQGSGGKFRPKDSITREEAAVVLAQMAVTLKKTGTVPSSGGTFADMNSISPWAKDAVGLLQTMGAVQGKGNNSFDPRGFVTRAEIAKMLYVMLND
ncbi:S-layer homology domain-containing protein [Paenibacillus sp. DMB20]|uniref:S-layer homology domain-containing protein n=1 Tax=Paenibacillus sp. DMB20 TaxID=1642570 RepID=UPI0006992D3A|nr:S-layer homology domain-containing protein [Paenibacillus sp. DMB20]